MSIIRVSKAANEFALVDKSPANDDRLSFKAKGIMFYLLTKPDGWKLQVKDLIKHASDGRDSVYAGINELIKMGYIQRNEIRDGSGKYATYEYVVFERPLILDDEPLTENPDTAPLTEKPDTGKSYTEKPDISNNEFSNNELKKEEEEESTPDFKSIPSSKPSQEETDKQMFYAFGYWEGVQEPILTRLYDAVKNSLGETKQTAQREALRKFSEAMKEKSIKTNPVKWFCTTLESQEIMTDEEF